MQNSLNENMISIIVPVYNAAGYITRCIDSIFNSSEKNWEVIAIDDGSTDDSLSILHQYSAHHNFFIVTQKNNGVSSARNAGINKARGKFICFVDSDDFLPVDALSVYRNLLQYEPGMIVGESISYSSDGMNIVARPKPGSIRMLNNKEAFKDMLYDNPKHGVCDKMFLAEVILKNDIRFNEDIYNFEDLLFIIQYLHAMGERTTALTPAVTYNYVMSEGSATRSQVSEKQFTYYMAFNSIEELTPKELKRYYYHLFLKVTSSHLYKAYSQKNFSSVYIDTFTVLYRNAIWKYLFSGVVLDAWTAYFFMFSLSPRFASLIRKLLQKGPGGK